MSTGATERTRPTYTFAPLERRGLVAGVRTGQLLVVLGGVAAGVYLLGHLPRYPGGIAFFAMVALGAVAAMRPVRERTLDQWVAVAAGYWTRPRVTQRYGAPGTYALVLPGVAILEDPERGHGVVRERLAGGRVVWAGVLQCRGRPFALRSAEGQVPTLASWGEFLASLCREQSPLRRVQVIDRTVRADSVSHHDYVRERGDPRSPFYEQYWREILAQGAPLEHESFVVVQVARPRLARRTGGEAAGLAALRDELDRLRGQLAERQLLPDGAAPLTARGIADVIRTAYDPQARSGLRESSPSAIAPAYEEERFSQYRTAGVVHATLWVRNPPHIPVRPAFLVPFLLETRATRTFSVTYTPVPPSRAVSRTEAARTADSGDASLRARYGFLESERRRAEREGVERLESELAGGHQLLEFSGYITVTSADADTLERELAEVEAQARRCHLETSRCYGEQAQAFTFTLPLCRGLA